MHFPFGVCIVTISSGCTTIPKSIIRNSLGVMEKVPGVNFFIGGTSDLIINTVEMVENEIILVNVIDDYETITAKALYGGISWNKVRKRLRNPHAVALFLNTLDYQEEQKGQDHTQLPEETLNLAGDDCEDFAYIVFDALHYNGYETKMLSISGKK